MNTILNYLFVGYFLRMWKAAWYILLAFLVPALYENYVGSNHDGKLETFSIWAGCIFLACAVYSIIRSIRYES